MNYNLYSNQVAAGDPLITLSLTDLIIKGSDLFDTNLRPPIITDAKCE